jgi:hypothetical protein
MNTLLVIAVGSKYTDLLINNYKYLLNRVEVVVYTDDKEKLNKAIPTADIRVYKESTFRYFDKYTLTHQLTKEKRSAVLYVDVGSGSPLARHKKSPSGRQCFWRQGNSAA